MMHLPRRLPGPRARLPLLLAAALLAAVPLATPLAAQQPPAVPIPNPAAPALTAVFPPGITRGTGADITLTGTNLADPVALWTSLPGAKVTIPTDNNNGKDAAKLRVRLDLPADAPVGFVALRLATRRGISNLRLLAIDDLPTVPEVDSNRARATPQPITVPCAVVGRADAEQTDVFQVTAQAGQRLSAEVIGRRLGSAFDPMLSLIDPRTGRELAHSNDAPGLQTDPRLSHTFKEAGTYLLEVRDVMYRGGPDFVYRLRVGDFPCACTPIPMAARRGSKATVAFAGPTVDGASPVEVAVPTDPAVTAVAVTPRFATGPAGWPVTLAVSDHDELLEQEPNNEPAKATRLPVPAGVTGRFQQKGDVDHFVFPAKKGQKLVLEARTLNLGSPAEVLLTLRDVKGAQLAASNPTAAPRLDFTAPADGDFSLAVEHLFSWGGPAETYHLTVTPARPDFALPLTADRLDLPKGGVALLPIPVTRRDYPGPIEVALAGARGLTGTLTVPAGQPAANQPAGPLAIEAAPDAPLGPQVVTIQGRATLDGQPALRTASAAAPVQAALANLPFPPAAIQGQFAVTVTEPGPFTLALKVEPGELLRGQAGNLVITARRADGFADEIALTAGPLPANVAAALKPIPKGAAEVKVPLTPAANAALGASSFYLLGKAKFQNRDVTVIARPVSLVIAPPFDLKATPSGKLAPGGKATLQVSARRRAGYAGPIALQVRNLPAGVTAAALTLNPGQDSGAIELTAAANAALGDKADVNVLGTAPAGQLAANQTQPSDNFTLSVGK